MGMSISLIWNGTRLLAFRHNPRCAVHLNDVVGGQVLDVRERDARPTTEQEQVSCQCKVGIVQLDCAQRLDYIFCEKATLLMVGGNMIHRKRVSWYLAVVVRRGDDVFQRYGVYPHGRLRQPHFVAQVQAIVTDEVLRQFVHRHIRPFILPLDELRNISPDNDMFLICTYGAVFAHPFGKRLVLLVKSSEQCFILRADALIGVAYHFSSNKRLTVGKPLVVLRYLRLDVVKRIVHHHRLTALAFRPVAFGIPQILGDAPLTTELRNSPVIVPRPMMGTIPFFSLLPFT